MTEEQHKLQARTSWRAHRNGRPWTREDDAAIREVLDGDDEAVCQVALTLGRSFTSLRARRGLLRGMRDDLARLSQAPLGSQMPPPAAAPAAPAPTEATHTTLLITTEPTTGPHTGVSGATAVTPAREHP